LREGISLLIEDDPRYKEPLEAKGIQVLVLESLESHVEK